ncbi:hypothetical protein EYF80_031820 [Liparis tanakae]|uniref:Uncharacterized protein n=1 Tax=Liparis tanakae TaxID=230148 RepID=A0A4Z2GWU4_9TELE|nr:hypothetical protein EYF80_031820 [Liparis tanakae]
MASSRPLLAVSICPSMSFMSVSSFFLAAVATALCLRSSSNSVSSSRTCVTVAVELGLQGLHVDLQTQLGVLGRLQLVLQLLQLGLHLLHLGLQTSFGLLQLVDLPSRNI